MILQVQVCLGLDQSLDALDPSRFGGAHQGRPAILVREVGIAADPQKGSHSHKLSRPGCFDQFRTQILSGDAGSKEERRHQHKQRSPSAEPKEFGEKAPIQNGGVPHSAEHHRDNLK